MDLPQERIPRIWQAAGLTWDPDRTLTESEVRRLCMAVFRNGSFPRAVQEKKPPGGPAPRPDPPTDPWMEELVRTRTIMIDTCSLMHSQCGAVMDRMLPALERQGKKVVIPLRVIDELRKHQNARHDPGKARAANEGMRICRRLQKAGCLSVRGNEGDDFADNVFFVVLSDYRYRYHMLLITQDRNLTTDVLQLNRQQATQGYPVEVMRIDRHGRLQRSGNDQ